MTSTAEDLLTQASWQLHVVGLAAWKYTTLIDVVVAQA